MAPGAGRSGPGRRTIPHREPAPWESGSGDAGV